MSIEKVTWNEIRDATYLADPFFTEKVDSLKPNEKYPLYLVTFPYGAIIGDDKSQFIPTEDGSYCRLSSAGIPKEIMKDIGYGKDSSPLGLILEKTIEFFVDVPERKLTIPKKIARQGDFINFSRILNVSPADADKPFAPNGLLKACAGARTVFSLPYLTCNASFTKLERDIGTLSKIPASQYDHFQLFRDISKSQESTSNWRLKLLYFSEKWISSILNDKRWADIKSYIFQKAWEETHYNRHQYFFDVSFSIMKEQENAKQNPYIYDTARHIFDIAVGAFPGLSPTISSEMLPLDLIQTTLIKSYGLKKYIPTIISPNYFSFENNYPIYYSLHYPTLRLFSPKTSSNKKSVLGDMQDLSRALTKFSKRIRDEESIWNGTILQEITSKLNFKFIHTASRDGVKITDPLEVVNSDSRFLDSIRSFENLTPSLDGNFFRGCVCLSKN